MEAAAAQSRENPDESEMSVSSGACVWQTGRIEAQIDAFFLRGKKLSASSALYKRPRSLALQGY
jgi:hypothetical protein